MLHVCTPGCFERRVVLPVLSVSHPDGLAVRALSCRKVSEDQRGRSVLTAVLRASALLQNTLRST